MMSTPNRGIPYIPEGALDPAAASNDALDIIDALLQTAVISMSLTEPPSSPNDGDMYIPAATATGSWEGLEGYVVRYRAEGNFWQAFTPGVNVVLVLNLEDGGLYRYDSEDSPPSWGPAIAGTAVDPTLRFLTFVDEASLPNSRRLVAGTNVTFDTTVAGELKINAASGGGGGGGAAGFHMVVEQAQLTFHDTEVDDFGGEEIFGNHWNEVESV